MTAGVTPPSRPGPEDTSLASVLDDFERAGFSADLMASDEGVLCGSCRSLSRAGELLVHRVRRLEGASDPADMLAVVGATCPGCGSDGALVLSYGPGSDPVQSDVLAALQVPDVPGVVGPSPGEARPASR